MSVIDTIIEPQAGELVRDRIGAILADEFAKQVELSGNQDINAVVFIERVIAFDKTDMPAINVCLAKGNFSDQTVRQTDGTYTFNIDFYTKAKSKNNEPADKKALLLLHRIMGIGRAILEDARYKTLGFAPPFIMRRYVSQLDVSNPSTDDAATNVMGRLLFIVKVPEVVDLMNVRMLGGYGTTVKLHETEKGYRYFGENVQIFDETFDYTHE